MPLTRLEHLLIQSTDIEATRDWYVNVLGMTVGPHPDFKIPVYWLYLDGTDVLHIAEGGANVPEARLKYAGQESTATHGSGVVDHIAFRASGLDAMIENLRRHNIAFKERQVDNQGLYQLFLHDPNGVKIELNFEASEAKGRRADLMASDLAAARN